MGADLTTLLVAWGRGDQAAFDQLVCIVHDELHRLAHRYMTGRRADGTLQSTALVNEAFLRLVHCGQVRWQDRTHFFAVSANLMRRILVDYARSRNYQSVAPVFDRWHWTKLSTVRQKEARTWWRSMIR
jgi:RNA polymerase sigma factor (TIGR02999 family)